MPGNAPASPAPKRKRMMASEVKLHAAAVNPVKSDQNATTAVRSRLAPKRSARIPEGVCNNAYTKANEDMTTRHCLSESCSSATIGSRAVEMHARSTYKRTDNMNVLNTTR